MTLGDCQGLSTIGCPWWLHHNSLEKAKPRGLLLKLSSGEQHSWRGPAPHGLRSGSEDQESQAGLLQFLGQSTSKHCGSVRKPVLLHPTPSAGDPRGWVPRASGIPTLLERALSGIQNHTDHSFLCCLHSSVIQTLYKKQWGHCGGARHC